MAILMAATAASATPAASHSRVRTAFWSGLGNSPRRTSVGSQSAVTVSVRLASPISSCAFVATAARARIARSVGFVTRPAASCRPASTASSPESVNIPRSTRVRIATRIASPAPPRRNAMSR